MSAAIAIDGSGNDFRFNAVSKPTVD